MELVQEGDRLVLRTHQDQVAENQRLSDDLEVVAPRGIIVEARSSSGDFELADLTANVELTTTGRSDVRLARLGGDARLDINRSDLVRATDIKGSIDLRGQGSDIDFENIGGQVTISGAYRGSLEFKNLARPLQYDGPRNTELRVQAVPGRISMDLGQFSAQDIVGPTRLIAASRDIKVERFTDSLQVETERGDIELIPGRMPLPSIEARSGNGRIDLALPPRAAFSRQLGER